MDEELINSLLYDPDTGKIFWRTRISATNGWNKLYAGKETFKIKHAKGYLTGKIMGNRYLTHRVAWFLHYGQWPQGEIDHINGNKSDNRIKNLRDVTTSQNQMNRGKPVNNKSGFKGVFWHKSGKKWCASIGINGRNIYLGLFESKSEANDAYMYASKKLHREFSWSV